MKVCRFGLIVLILALTFVCAGLQPGEASAEDAGAPAAGEPSSGILANLDPIPNGSPGSALDPMFIKVAGKRVLRLDWVAKSGFLDRVQEQVKAFAKKGGEDWTYLELAMLFVPDSARSIYDEKMVDVIDPRQPKRRSKTIKRVYPILMSDERLADGGKVAEQQRELLQKAYDKWQVWPWDILALLNIESKFGQFRGNYTVFNIFLSEALYLERAEREHLAQGSYAEEDALSRASNLRRVEKISRRGMINLGALLAFSKKLGLDPREVKGSFSGAIGICQFLPFNLIYADDGNADGRADLNDMEDAIFSTAKFLVRHGYRKESVKARRRSFYRYNHNDEYVRAVFDFAERMKAAYGDYWTP